MNTESVKGLGLDWYMDLPDDGLLTGTLVVDGGFTLLEVTLKQEP